MWRSVEFEAWSGELGMYTTVHTDYLRCCLFVGTDQFCRRTMQYAIKNKAT